MGGFRFLAHRSCHERLLAFVQANPNSGASSLGTQIKKIREDPYNAGEKLKFSHPTLKGLIYKIWVRGDSLSRGQGYRLIYLLSASEEVALGIFFSDVPRKDFDYEPSEWLAIAELVEKDFKRGSEDQFVEISPA